jgi:hypothetical protein
VSLSLSTYRSQSIPSFGTAKHRVSYDTVLPDITPPQHVLETSINLRTLKNHVAKHEKLRVKSKSYFSSLG